MQSPVLIFGDFMRRQYKSNAAAALRALTKSNDFRFVMIWRAERGGKTYIKLEYTRNRCFPQPVDSDAPLLPAGGEDPATVAIGWIPASNLVVHLPAEDSASKAKTCWMELSWSGVTFGLPDGDGTLSGAIPTGVTPKATSRRAGEGSTGSCEFGAPASLIVLAAMALQGQGAVWDERQLHAWNHFKVPSLKPAGVVLEAAAAVMHLAPNPTSTAGTGMVGGVVTEAVHALGVSDAIETMLTCLQEAPYVGSIVKVLLLVKRGIAAVVQYDALLTGFQLDVDRYTVACENLHEVYPDADHPPGKAVTEWLQQLEDALASALGLVPREEAGTAATDASGFGSTVWNWLKRTLAAVKGAALHHDKLIKLQQVLRDRWLELSPALGIEALAVAKAGTSSLHEQLQHIAEELQGMQVADITAKFDQVTAQLADVRVDILANIHNLDERLSQLDETLLNGLSTTTTAIASQVASELRSGIAADIAGLQGRLAQLDAEVRDGVTKTSDDVSTLVANIRADIDTITSGSYERMNQLEELIQGVDATIVQQVGLARTEANEHVAETHKHLEELRDEITASIAGLDERLTRLDEGIWRGVNDSAKRSNALVVAEIRADIDSNIAGLQERLGSLNDSIRAGTADALEAAAHMAAELRADVASALSDVDNRVAMLVDQIAQSTQAVLKEVGAARDEANAHAAAYERHLTQTAADLRDEVVANLAGLAEQLAQLDAGTPEGLSQAVHASGDRVVAELRADIVEHTSSLQAMLSQLENSVNRGAAATGVKMEQLCAETAAKMTAVNNCLAQLKGHMAEGTRAVVSEVAAARVEAAHHAFGLHDAIGHVAHVLGNQIQNLQRQSGPSGPVTVVMPVNRPTLPPSELDNVLKKHHVSLGSLPHCFDDRDRSTSKIPLPPIPLTLWSTAKQQDSSLDDGVAAEASSPEGTAASTAAPTAPESAKLIGLTPTAASELGGSSQSSRQIHVVSGEAGTGKTCLLQTIAYCHAAEVSEKESRGGLHFLQFAGFKRVVFLRLRELVDGVMSSWSVSSSIGEVAARVVAEAYKVDATYYDMENLRNILFEWPNARRTLWLLDAFDEVAGAAGIVHELAKSAHAANTLHLMQGADGEDRGQGADLHLTPLNAQDKTPTAGTSEAARLAVLKVFVTQPHVIITTRPRFADELGLSKYVQLDKLHVDAVQSFVAAAVSDAATLARLRARMVASPKLVEAMRTPVIMHMAMAAEELDALGDGKDLVRRFTRSSDSHTSFEAERSPGGTSATRKHHSEAASATVLPNPSAVADLYERMEMRLWVHISQKCDWKGDMHSRWKELVAMLEDVALEGCASNETTVTWPQDQQGLSPSGAHTWANALKDISKGRIIDLLSNKRIEFVHRSLQEYFAARAILRRWAAGQVGGGAMPSLIFPSASGGDAAEGKALTLADALCAAPNDMLRRFVMAYACNDAIANWVVDSICSRPEAVSELSGCVKIPLVLLQESLHTAEPHDRVKLAQQQLGASKAAGTSAAASTHISANSMAMISHCITECAFAHRVACSELFAELAAQVWKEAYAYLPPTDTSAVASTGASPFDDAKFWVVADAMTDGSQRKRAVAMIHGFMDSVNPFASISYPLVAVQVLRHLGCGDRLALDSLVRLQKSRREQVQLAAIVAAGVLGVQTEAARDTLLQFVADSGKPLNVKLTAFREVLMRHNDDPLVIEKLDGFIKARTVSGPVLAAIVQAVGRLLPSTTLRELVQDTDIALVNRSRAAAEWLLTRRGVALREVGWDASWTPLHALASVHFSVKDIALAGTGRRPKIDEWDASDVIRGMLASGLNLEARTKEGQTPLDLAASRGNIDILQLLMHNGAKHEALPATADVNMCLWAQVNECKPVRLISMLIALGADVRLQDEAGNTLLHIAAVKSADALKVLIAAGASTNAASKDGATPMHRAAEKNMASLKVLLAAGANKEATDDSGRTPAHIAAQKNTEALSVLLTAGANMEAGDRHGKKPLHLAATTSVASCKVLLAAGANKNAVENENGITPLHLAAEKFADALAPLLAANANKEAVDQQGRTPLHVAAVHNVTSLKALLAAGCNTAAMNKDGKTPLHLAAEKNPESLSPLITAGARKEAVDKHGCTALHVAAQSTSPDAVKILLASGAKKDALDKYGKRPVHYAIHHHVGALKALIAAGVNKDAPNADGWTPMHYAAQKSVQALKVLLAAGANREIADNEGKTPLYVAAQMNTESLQVLLAAGANKAATDKSGWAPVHAAAQVSVGALHALLAAGADKDASGPGGWTPMHWAAQINADSLKLLLLAGANVHVADKQGKTPLHVAAESCPEAVPLLVNAGADKEAATNLGLTPMHVAAQTNSASLKLLLAAGANTDAVSLDRKTPMHFAAQKSVDSLKMLLEAGVKPTANDKDGKTPLHVAAQTNVECVSALLAAGVNVEAVDNHGWTPMHWAAQMNAASVKVLLAAGARKEAVDKHGWTPVHWAAQVNVESLKLLLESGANIEAVNKVGWRPIHYAALKNVESLRVLLEAGANTKAVTKDGKSAMHYAALSNVESLKVLLSAGANKEATDNDGKTPLHVAALENPEAFTVLLVAGANKTAVDKRGRSIAYYLDMRAAAK
jgi:ankyrin repeat protein/ElaB/YqjD/DUF883 family membrane-anchored ribosome-binding protein